MCLERHKENSGPLLGHWIVLGLVLLFGAWTIYFIATRRLVDFSDEGFYYTSAWLAYSGDALASRVFMNFGVVLGAPYLVMQDPPIVVFRISSLGAWLLVHYFFFSSFAKAHRVQIGSPWLWLLAIAGLFVFLIPSVSYQNLPYLFTLLVISCVLRAPFTKNGLALSFLTPAIVAGGIISYTPFLLFVPWLLWWAYRSYFDHRILHLPAFAAGVLVMLASSVVSFFPILSASEFLEAFEFFNHDAGYTSLTRLVQKSWSLFLELAPSGAIGIVLAILSKAIKGMFDETSRSKFLLGSYWCVASILCFIAFSRDCLITCDANVITLVKVSIMALPVIVVQLVERHGDWRSCEWLAIYISTALLIAVLSYAPYQYNIKYVSPAIVGTISIITIAAAREWEIFSAIGITGVLAAAALALRVLLFSSYGASSPWQADVALPGWKFSGLYGDATRRDLVHRLNATYQELKCSEKFFAAVDSLALPYFLLSRRPPFPHAWVATRSSMPRQLIGAQREACVVMQDRVLPGTASDARTMLDYLRVDPRYDAVQVRPLGENIYMISFSRQK